MRANFSNIVMASLLLVSCIKISEDTTSSAEIAILFKTGDAGIKGGAEATDQIELESFYVSAMNRDTGIAPPDWQNISFWKEGSNYFGKKYWDIDNKCFSFFASNIMMSFEHGDPEISVTNRRDALYSSIANPLYKDINTLAFEHVFAKIGSVSVEPATGCTIKEVSISMTPKTAGTYDLLTAQWSSTEEGELLTISCPAPWFEIENLLLIPTEYELSFEWEILTEEGMSSLRRTRKNITFNKGVATSIICTLGDENEVSLKTNTEEWDNQKRGTPILFNPSIIDWYDRTAQGGILAP